MKRDSPAIPHGTAPPAEKKFFMLFPLFEKSSPVQRIPSENSEMVR